MKRVLIGLALIALVVVPLLIVRPAPNSGAFAGTDDQAQALIEEMRPGYHPWFRPLWQPPGQEISTLLFSLQAAAGGGIVGYCLGLARGRAQKTKGTK